jgi:putative hydrolase of the HAD superfamily
MAQINNVVFDIYGVLVIKGHNIRDILFPLFKNHKTHRYSRIIYQQYATGNISQTDFWLKIGKSDYQKLETSFLKAHKIDKNLFSLLKIFRKKGLKLYVLSNIPREWSKYLIKKFYFKNIFSGEVYSWQTHSRKPELDNFNLLVNKYKLNPKNTLFIDDKIPNIRSAKKFGFITCWFNRENLNLHPFTADFIITNSKELKNFIL